MTRHPFTEAIYGNLTFNLSQHIDVLPCGQRPPQPRRPNALTEVALHCARRLKRSLPPLLYA